MAIIPLPERGQPVDLSYLYQIVSAVNDISTDIASTSYNYTTIDTSTAGKQSVKTAQAKIIGGYIEVVNDTTVTAGNETAFSYSFPADYAYPPIATATPINIGNTPAGNVTLTLKSVSTQRIDGVVKFNTSGNASVGVNLIIIGIPN